MTVALSIVGHDRDGGRPKDDFYPTPPEIPEALLEVETSWPSLSVWEPACGKGHISKVLQEHGFGVISTDLNDYGYGHTGIDFLATSTARAPVIITNPPFKLAQLFAEHALALGVQKLALFGRLAFLESKGRRAFFETSPLRKVWVFSRRVHLTRRGEKPRGGGMIAFAWFVWQAGYEGEPTIGWL